MTTDLLHIRSRRPQLESFIPESPWQSSHHLPMGGRNMQMNAPPEIRLVCTPKGNGAGLGEGFLTARRASLKRCAVQTGRDEQALLRGFQSMESADASVTMSSSSPSNRDRQQKRFRSGWAPTSDPGSRADTPPTLPTQLCCATTELGVPLTADGAALRVSHIRSQPVLSVAPSNRSSTNRTCKRNFQASFQGEYKLRLELPLVPESIRQGSPCEEPPQQEILQPVIDSVADSNVYSDSSISVLPAQAQCVTCEELVPGQHTCQLSILPSRQDCSHCSNVECPHGGTCTNDTAQSCATGAVAPTIPLLESSALRNLYRFKVSLSVFPCLPLNRQMVLSLISQYPQKYLAPAFFSLAASYPHSFYYRRNAPKEKRLVRKYASVEFQPTPIASETVPRCRSITEYAPVTKPPARDNPQAPQVARVIPCATSLRDFSTLQLLDMRPTSQVYSAFYPASGTYQVLKIIPKAVATASIPQEVSGGGMSATYRLIAAHRNTHIPRISSIFDHQNQTVIAMESYNGPTLFDFLMTRLPGSLSDAQCRHIVSQVLTALTVLHQQKIVHRDVKLENVMFKSPVGPAADCLDGRPGVVNLPDVGLIDFDLATNEICSSSGETNSGSAKEIPMQILGTPAYMAPEAWRGEITTAFDMWSCGVLLYALVRGQFPYPPSNMGTRNNCPYHSFLLVPGMDSECWRRQPAAADLVQRLLRIDPSRRIQTASEALQHAWFQESSSAARGPLVSH